MYFHAKIPSSKHEILDFLHFKVPGLTDYCVSQGLHFHATLCDLSKKNVKDIHTFMYHFTFILFKTVKCVYICI